MATEAEIQRGIVTFLRSIGGAVWVTSQGYRKDPGGTRMTPGLPDLIVMFAYKRKGWTFAEVKTPKGKLSPAQVVFRDEAIAAGVPWEMWRSVDDAAEWAKRRGLVAGA